MWLGRIILFKLLKLAFKQQCYFFFPSLIVTIVQKQLKILLYGNILQTIMLKKARKVTIKIPRVKRLKQNRKAEFLKAFFFLGGGGGCMYEIHSCKFLLLRRNFKMYFIVLKKIKLIIRVL